MGSASSSLAWLSEMWPRSISDRTDGRQLEQAHEVGDGRAVLADADGHLVLGEAEVAAQALEGARLLDRVEVLAQQVLDDGHLHGLLVGDVADERGDGGEAGLARGFPAALAGDDLVVAAGDGAHHDRL